MKPNSLNISLMMVAVIVLVSFFWYLQVPVENNNEQNANSDEPIFIEDRPKIDLSSFDCSSGGLAKMARCRGRTIESIRKTQRAELDTIAELREYLVAPYKYRNSKVVCDQLRDKFIDILVKKNDVPADGAIVTSQDRLIFNFRHPYFDLPGNDGLPRQFSKQSSVDNITEKFKLDRKPGSNIYGDEENNDDALIYEMGITASLFREVVYLYESYLYNVETGGPFLCTNQ